jgi:L-galactose dehydrogenase
MVGFNILNQSARELVLAPAQRSGIGVLGMFAVRRALSDPARLAQTLGALAADGYLDGQGPGDDSVGWLLAGSDARTLTELAYRFCVHEPGIGSVLFGTGNRDHLEANIGALLGSPLPEQTTARLRGLFGQITHVSAN